MHPPSGARAPAAARRPPGPARCRPRRLGHSSRRRSWSHSPRAAAAATGSPSVPAARPAIFVPRRRPAGAGLRRPRPACGPAPPHPLDGSSPACCKPFNLPWLLRLQSLLGAPRLLAPLPPSPHPRPLLLLLLPSRLLLPPQPRSVFFRLPLLLRALLPLLSSSTTSLGLAGKPHGSQDGRRRVRPPPGHRGEEGGPGGRRPTRAAGAACRGLTLGAQTIPGGEGGHLTAPILRP